MFELRTIIYIYSIANLTKKIIVPKLNYSSTMICVIDEHFGHSFNIEKIQFSLFNFSFCE